MIKQIKLADGTVKEMTFEQVLKASKGIIIKIAKKYKGQFITEDDLQEGNLALWKAFATYDEVHCFSTHATWLIRQRFQHLKVNETSPVRDTRDKEILNMEYDLGDGHSLGDLLSDESSKFEKAVVEKDFIQFIKSNLDEIEMDLLSFNLGYLKSKDIADKHNTSRQNICNKNYKFKKKLEQLIKEYNI